jgi:predicted nucleic acid-binding protein
MNYLLDTNIISELISKQPDQAVIDWIDQLDPRAVFISVTGLLQSPARRAPGAP